MLMLECLLLLQYQLQLKFILKLKVIFYTRTSNPFLCVWTFACLWKGKSIYYKKYILKKMMCISVLKTNSETIENESNSVFLYIQEIKKMIKKKNSVFLCVQEIQEKLNSVFVLKKWLSFTSGKARGGRWDRMVCGRHGHFCQVGLNFLRLVSVSCCFCFFFSSYPPCYTWIIVFSSDRKQVEISARF